MGSDMKELAFVRAISGIENAEALDPLVTKLRTVVNALLKPPALRDVLHGVPFGHPIHPFLVQIPIGAWTSAAVLDVLPGMRKASTALIATGVASAIPAAVAGYADWSDLHEQQMRVGIVHLAGNVTAVGLYSASLVQRMRGKRGSGKLLGFLGLVAVSGAGFLGGHLSYRLAAGANHLEDFLHVFPTGWQRLGAVDEIPEGELTRRTIADQPLLVFRSGGEIEVIAGRCSHLSGPLDQGELSESASGVQCVTCPWHGSVFSIRTGEVVHGPATSPQAVLEVRVTDGQVEVLLPHAG
jgi:nitrite reductase/ring-hydroxylating ferredoxin subunit/uncharacterized membrane protein